MPSLQTFLLNLRAADIADVLVVSVLLYFLLQWLRRRTSRTGAFAIASLVILYVAARLLNMYLTLLIFQVGVSLIFIALIIVFQQDIRNWLERLSSWRYSRGRARKHNRREIIDPLAEAVLQLADKRIGALIVVKGRQPIDLYTRGGIVVDGRLSIPLLSSIFTRNSPAHDGAVVVNADRIESFAVHLPLSKSLAEVGGLGTRHTAALGLSECCDALVIAVSEERGTISLAEEGKLRVMQSPAAFNARLESFYNDRFPTHRQADSPRLLLGNWPMKIVSVTLAVLLWFFLAFRVEIIQRTFDAVPIEYRNIPSDWIVENDLPPRMSITLTGSERAFAALDESSLKVSLDLQKIQEGDNEIPVTGEQLKIPQGLSVRPLDTNVVKLFAYPVATVSLPVEANTVGWLAEPLKLENVEIKPPKVAVVMPSSELPQHKELVTEPIYLNEIKQTTTLQPKLILPLKVRFADIKQPHIDVTLHVKSKEPPKGETKSPLPAKASN